MAIETGITLYRNPYNGTSEASITIAMSILDLQFEAQVIDTSNKEQLHDWYQKMDSIGHGLEGFSILPFITDTLPNGDKITLFETGTILEYIAYRYDYESRIKPRDCLKSDLKIMSWLYWSIGHFGPLLDQTLAYHEATENSEITGGQPRDQQVADYLTNQSRRYFRILDELLLKSHGCMTGDRPTIADIACFTWAAVDSIMQAGISLEEFPNVQRWVENMFTWAGIRNRKGTMTGQLDAIISAYSALRIT
ncbi:hypothetical protein E4U32_005620 [Claviceps aff. humidiphila group G2b]|nr:hypothetical protein E4U32_005620 [Claviceps aff. humidiphila group G2b]